MTLLKRLLPAHDVDALLGDILEESRHRSRIWYWSQLLAVVLVASWKDLRTHKSLALRATVTGALALPVFFLPASLVVRVVRVLSEGGYYVGPYWLTLPRNALLIVTPVLVDLTGFGLSGWIVARFHRDHGFAMVLPYMLVVLLLATISLVRLLTGYAASPVGLGGLSLMSVTRILAMLSLPACVAAGAVLGLKRDLGGVLDDDGAVDW